MKKVAVVHEWLTEWAGSERVLEQILACYPNAELFTLVDSLSDEDRAHIGGKHPSTSFIAKLPFARSKPWRYLPLMPLAIEQFDLSGYDLIISSSHAVAKGVITGPDQFHVSYVHSPMRYAWDLQAEYLRGQMGRLRGLALRLLLHYLRMWDTRTANGVDVFIANSSFVAKRIWKIYRREARIIAPPVNLAGFPMNAQKEDFYLCASRLMPYKRVEMVAEAFSAMPNRKLTIIGAGPQLKAVKRAAGTNVTVLGYQPDDVLKQYMQRAKAFVFAAQEDFGILPVEAQASGTPVIAFGKGGICDIIRDLDQPEPTGILFHAQSTGALIAAVERFEQVGSTISALNCRKNAERFSDERFRKEFKEFVDVSIAEPTRINRNFVSAF